MSRNVSKTQIKMMDISAMAAADTASRDYPLPSKRIVVGCGGLSVDYLACVASFPKPDDKIRTTSFEVQGGGCVGNALTAAARLGLTARVISKVADDGPGKQTVALLQADGIDTSHMVVAEGGNSPFTYIIVDKEQNTRTCIHTPISASFVSKDLSKEAVDRALSQADLVYFDGRFSDAALVVANKAARLHIPIILDAENWKREALGDLMQFAEYVTCSGSFPLGWTNLDNLAEAILAMASNLPRLKFLIVTLGASGCVMLEVAHQDLAAAEVLDVSETLKSLQQESVQTSSGQPLVLSSKVGRLTSAVSGGKQILGRLLVGTAESIPPEELVDTTGAGDAFVGGIIYSLCAGHPVEKMLPLAATVAGFCCRALGARPGLPHRSNPKVSTFLEVLSSTC